MCLEADGDCHGMDEFAGVFADTFSAEYSAGLVGEHFDVAVFGFHENGFAVVVERIIGAEIVDSALFELCFAEADAGDPRVGEDDAAEGVVIDALCGAPGCVFGSGFTLHDRHVHDFVWAGNIAAGIDARVAGALHGIAVDMAARQGADAGGGQAEPIGRRAPAECVEQVRGADALNTAVLLKLYGEVPFVLDTLQLGAGNELHALSAEFLLGDSGRLRRNFFENVGTALYLE